MNEDSENYDFEKVAEAAEYFQDITSYDREEAMPEDKQELLMDAVGAIGAFSSAVEEVDEQTDYIINGDYDDSEIRDAVIQAGVAWPDAIKAYQNITDASEQITEQFTAAAFHGDEEMEAAGETVEELSDLQQKYQKAMATAVSSSKTLGPEGYTTPVDTAIEVAENEEITSELEELEEQVPRSREESNQQLKEMIEGLQ